MLNFLTTNPDALYQVLGFISGSKDGEEKEAIKHHLKKYNGGDPNFIIQPHPNQGNSIFFETTLLNYCIDYKKPKYALWLIDELNANPSLADDNGFISLHSAVKTLNYELFVQLCEKGADITATLDRGNEKATLMDHLRLFSFYCPNPNSTFQKFYTYLKAKGVDYGLERNRRLQNDKLYNSLYCDQSASSLDSSDKPVQHDEPQTLIFSMAEFARPKTPENKLEVDELICSFVLVDKSNDNNNDNEIKPHESVYSYLKSFLY